MSVKCPDQNNWPWKCHVISNKASKQNNIRIFFQWILIKANIIFWKNFKFSFEWCVEIYTFIIEIKKKKLFSIFLFLLYIKCCRIHSTPNKKLRKCLYGTLILIWRIRKYQIRTPNFHKILDLEKCLLKLRFFII